MRMFLSDSPILLTIRPMVVCRADERLLALLAPNPRIDGGVQEIADPVGGYDTEDHDERDRFI